jgi:hypothetical protein
MDPIASIEVHRIGHIRKVIPIPLHESGNQLDINIIATGDGWESPDPGGNQEARDRAVTFMCI